MFIKTLTIPLFNTIIVKRNRKNKLHFGQSVNREGDI